MATKRNAADSTATKVTRISASDDGKKPVAKKAAVKADAPAKKAQTTTSDKRRTPWRATADYFAGAWFELREVRWPTRRATWGMTGALLAFTAFFVIVILILDAAFKYLFQVLLG